MFRVLLGAIGDMRGSTVETSQDLELPIFPPKKDSSFRSDTKLDVLITKVTITPDNFPEVHSLSTYSIFERDFEYTSTSEVVIPPTIPMFAEMEQLDCDDDDSWELSDSEDDVEPLARALMCTCDDSRENTLDHGSNCSFHLITKVSVER